MLYYTTSRSGPMLGCARSALNIPRAADIWNFGRDWRKECNNGADKQKTSLTTSLVVTCRTNFIALSRLWRGRFDILRGRRDRAQIAGDGKIFLRQFLEIADFHIRRNDAGPFGARAQKPATAPQQTRGMERCSPE